ncbi:BlaI/MecI/CopY family transcriptional regulator [Alteromonas oceanisediminis]|uniref:BlaI/MecI/CopY family transcriptional regulator n=1 Tax=Alteromonas oceanisediminis TaxID=2836180 RepID=UPI001BDB1903|nr:BlaI/MecI/CopY family transcriptional regulator [Alteromonas oceanisediminis]MBT0587591.1 BlaI/MecI/CopY family transcriptional regulator [Alteromonas oceanisediminis]
MTNNAKKSAQWLAQAPSASPAPTLGKREIEVMELFWSQGSALHTATDILQELNQHAGAADDTITLNTVQSTLERLSRKALLKRTKQGRAYAYQTVQSKHTVISRLIAEISEEISDDDPNVMLGGFIEFLETRHPKWTMPLTLLEGMSKLARKTVGN